MLTGGDERIVVASDARWTSARVGVENSDAFRVDMSLRGDPPSWVVGAPLVVSLRVLNLSMEPQDLMLLMAKDGEGVRMIAGCNGNEPWGGRRTRKRGGCENGPSTFQSCTTSQGESSV
jgi:hypothetical protein